MSTTNMFAFEGNTGRDAPSTRDTAPLIVRWFASHTRRSSGSQSPFTRRAARAARWASTLTPSTFVSNPRSLWAVSGGPRMAPTRIPARAGPLWGRGTRGPRALGGQAPGLPVDVELDGLRARHADLLMEGEERRVRREDLVPRLEEGPHRNVNPLA